MNTLNAIENLNKQLRISDVIDVLMSQTEKMFDIVHTNQNEINRLKEELDQLQTHMDNATDSIAS